MIHIGPRFQPRTCSAGRPAQVQVIVDGRNSNTAMIALNYVRSHRQSASTPTGQPPTASTGPPARLVTRAWFNPNLESRWFIVPGIVGMLTLVVTMLVTALSVAREREQGTFDQLLVTPLRPVRDPDRQDRCPGVVIGLVRGDR